MARHRGQKALYEVIGKSRSKSRQIQTLHTEKTIDKPTQEAPSQQQQSTPEMLAVEKRWLKPRALQFNNGQVELTVSYPVAGLTVLGLALLVIGAYRLGGRSVTALQVNETTAVPVMPERSVQPELASVDTRTTESSDLVVQADADTRPARAIPQGQAVRGPGYAIIIASYTDQTQLEPVQEFFIKNGVNCEIRRGSLGFMLVTSTRFDLNPMSPGTVGYELREKIIGLGAFYQPPPTYLTFTRETFESAYSIKLTD